MSANGANYVVALDGHFSLVYGTSASAPTFGAIITMINNERIAIGKKTLGYVQTHCVSMLHLLINIMQVSQSSVIPEPKDVQ